MATEKKTVKRLQIDLPAQVHKILKIDAIDKGTFLKA